MTVKLVIYILTAIFVVWSLESVNINQIFKKNKTLQARVLYFFIAIALIYLVANFFYDVYNNTKIIKNKGEYYERIHI